MDEKTLVYICLCAVVGLVGKIVWDWFKQTRHPTEIPHWCKKCGSLLERIHTMIGWIKDVHSPTDRDGIPLWYVPRTWGEKVETLDDNSKEQSLILKQILEEIKEMNQALRKANGIKK